MQKYTHYAIALVLVTLISAPLSAERLSIKPADIRDTWSYPPGALIINDRTLEPVSLRKAINPLTAATVRGVGAAQAQAANIIDGSRQTGWSPSSSDPESWWIEIDLGQVLPTQSLHLYFDESQSPLAFFTVSLSKGERFINSANVVVDGTLLYSRSERFAFNDAHDLELELEDELVRIVRIEADRAPEGLPRLLEIEMEAFGDNIALDLINKGGSVDVEASIVALAGSPAVMFDGDLSTMWRVNPLAKGSSGGSETFGDYRIDLGATYRIDSVWFLGEPLGVPPRLRHFYANFLSYKILYSDGSLAPDGSLAWDEVVAIPSDQKNLFDKRNFRHEFTPILARYLRLFYPTSEGGNIIGGGLSASSVRLDGLGLVSEFQAYGEGAPARVVLRSPVIDLGANWNITALDWQAAIPSGARLLVRSRSGDQVVEENHYFDKNGKEITQKRYEKLIASFRGPIETNLQPGDGWSPWSEAYTTTGSLFRSPSPRRYFQLELELLSDEPQASVSLSELGIEYSRPQRGDAAQLPLLLAAAQQRGDALQPTFTASAKSALRFLRKFVRNLQAPTSLLCFSAATRTSSVSQRCNFYSKTNILQVPYDLLKTSGTPYLQTLRHGYDGARHLDAPITFVSERQLIEGKKTPKILVLPACRYLPKPVFAALDNYLRQGGTLVLLPAGPQADEYARPQDYLARWGLHIRATHLPSIEGRGPAQQGYDQSLAHDIHIGPGHLQTSTYTDSAFFPDSTVSTHGLFEEIEADGADVLAATDEHPLLLRQPIGNGSLYYFCGTPSLDTYRRFTDRLMDLADIYRPLRLTSPDGSRLPGVEARLVHTQYYDLVYLANETKHDIEFTLTTQRPYEKARELRSLSYRNAPTGTLKSQRTLLFKLMTDPTEQAHTPHPSPHPYHGL